MAFDNCIVFIDKNPIGVDYEDRSGGGVSLLFLDRLACSGVASQQPRLWKVLNAMSQPMRRCNMLNGI